MTHPKPRQISRSVPRRPPVKGAPSSNSQPCSSQADSSPGTANQTIPEEYFPLPMRYKLSIQTVALLLTLPRAPSTQSILQTASQANEHSRVVLIPEERAFFRSINTSNHIRWTLAVGNPSQAWHKVNLLVQMELSGQEWPANVKAARRKEIMGEKKGIFAVMKTIVRCVVDIMGLRRDAVGLKHGLELLRSMEAGVWDEERRELLQVEGIGLVSAGKLVDAQILTCKDFVKTEPWNIERIMTRNPPFGTGMHRRMSQFPLLTMSLEQVGRIGDDTYEGGKTAVFRVVLGYENKEVPKWRALWLRVVFWAERKRDGDLVFFWRGAAQKLEPRGDVEGLEVLFGAKLDVDDDVVCYVSCEEVVGTTVVKSLKAI